MNGSARSSTAAPLDRPRQHRAALRAGERHAGPLVGDAGDLDRELRPDRLAVELHVRHHRAGIGGGGGDVERALAEARDGAVVEHDPVLAQHQRRSAPCRSAAAGAGCSRAGRGTGRHPGPGRRSCRAARRRPGRPPRARVRASRSVAASRSSPARGIVARPPPQPGVDELGAGRDVPVVHRRQAQRPEVARRPRARRARRAPPARRAGGRWSVPTAATGCSESPAISARPARLPVLP